MLSSVKEVVKWKGSSMPSQMHSMVPGTVGWHSQAAVLGGVHSKLEVHRRIIYKADLRDCPRQCSSSEAQTLQSHDTDPKVCVIMRLLLFVSF